MARNESKDGVLRNLKLVDPDNGLISSKEITEQMNYMKEDYSLPDKQLFMIDSRALISAYLSDEGAKGPLKLLLDYLKDKIDHEISVLKQTIDSRKVDPKNETQHKLEALIKKHDEMKLGYEKLEAEAHKSDEKLIESKRINAVAAETIKGLQAKEKMCQEFVAKSRASMDEFTEKVEGLNAEVDALEKKITANKTEYDTEKAKLQADHLEEMKKLNGQNVLFQKHTHDANLASSLLQSEVNRLNPLVIGYKSEKDQMELKVDSLQKEVNTTKKSNASLVKELAELQDRLFKLGQVAEVINKDTEERERNERALALELEINAQKQAALKKKEEKEKNDLIVATEREKKVRDEKAVKDSAEEKRIAEENSKKLKDEADKLRILEEVEKDDKRKEKELLEKKEKDALEEKKKAELEEKRLLEEENERRKMEEEERLKKEKAKSKGEEEVVDIPVTISSGGKQVKQATIQPVYLLQDEKIDEKLLGPKRDKLSLDDPVVSKLLENGSSLLGGPTSTIYSSIKLKQRLNGGSFKNDDLAYLFFQKKKVDIENVIYECLRNGENGLLEKYGKLIYSVTVEKQDGLIFSENAVYKHKKGDTSVLVSYIPKKWFWFWLIGIDKILDKDFKLGPLITRLKNAVKDLGDISDQFGDRLFYLTSFPVSSTESTTNLTIQIVLKALMNIVSSTGGKLASVRRAAEAIAGKNYKLDRIKEASDNRFNKNSNLKNLFNTWSPVSTDKNYEDPFDINDEIYTNEMEMDKGGLKYKSVGSIGNAYRLLLLETIWLVYVTIINVEATIWRPNSDLAAEYRYPLVDWKRSVLHFDFKKSINAITLDDGSTLEKKHKDAYTDLISSVLPQKKIEIFDFEDFGEDKFDDLIEEM